MVLGRNLRIASSVIWMARVCRRCRSCSAQRRETPDCSSPGPAMVSRERHPAAPHENEFRTRTRVDRAQKRADRPECSNRRNQRLVGNQWERGLRRDSDLFPHRAGDLSLRFPTFDRGRSLHGLNIIWPPARRPFGTTWRQRSGRSGDGRNLFSAPSLIRHSLCFLIPALSSWAFCSSPDSFLYPGATG
jgi:hypothetical protein